MVKKRLLLLILFLLFATHCFSQKLKTVWGEYTYVVPETETREEGKNKAFEKAKRNALEKEFGTIVSQTNVTDITNRDGHSDIDFSSFGESEVKGEWIETIGEPNYKFSCDKESGRYVIYVSVKGKARAIERNDVDLKVCILNNNNNENSIFVDGEHFYLSFTSPINGYIVAYLLDENEKAFCLLPYERQENGNIEIKANQNYTFFSRELSPENLKPYVDEYMATTSRSSEHNQIYVIFSTKPFCKAVDNESGYDNATHSKIPRTLTKKDFQQWLSKSQTLDKTMQVIKKVITIVAKE